MKTKFNPGDTITWEVKTEKIIKTKTKVKDEKFSTIVNISRVVSSLD